MEFRNNNNKFAAQSNGNFALGKTKIPAKINVSLFDYMFAVLSILFLSDNFWQIIIKIFPQSNLFSNAIIVETLRSAIMALGFVGIAVKWEIAIKILGRFFIFLFGIALAIMSVFWSIDPAFSLHQGLNLLLLMCFSLALALRFELVNLSILAVSIAIFSIISQFALMVLKLPQTENLLFQNGEIAFLLVSSIWACFSIRKYQLIFAPIALFSAIIGVFSQDILVIGAILAMICAWAMINIFRFNHNVEIGIASVISIFMFLGALVILTLGNSISNALSDFYSQFDLKTILGQGFGIGENNIKSYFGAGLGLLGLCYGMLFLFFCLAIISIKARSHKYVSIIIFGFFALPFLGLNIFPLISIPVIFLIATICASLRY